ncbi:MAG: translation initiation factor IF-3, partial [Clostridia bacterium]|nr:translation initiation factor IF-3 [Clostridia bacterium]
MCAWVVSACAFIIFWGCLNISAKELQINEEIRDKELRIISSNGEQLGIMSASEAQKIADEQNLDLVKISPQAKPPVCKIMDYGKYRFDMAKREKEARKNQRIVEV